MAKNRRASKALERLGERVRHLGIEPGTIGFHWIKMGELSEMKVLAEMICFVCFGSPQRTCCFSKGKYKSKFLSRL